MELELRYRMVARSYNLVSGEPVYRVGRQLGIEALELRPGDVVLDVGCGTGLNFGLLQDAIGPTGQVIGVDASAAMLTQAAARSLRAGWTNVHLVRADATTVDADTIRARVGRDCDAVLATYALSLMPQWRSAWRTMVAAAEPGARIAVVDMQRPVDRPAPLRWLAELACRLGGSDIDAHPWTALEQECTEVRAAQAWGGHIQVRSGRRPPAELRLARSRSGTAS